MLSAKGHTLDLLDNRWECYHLQGQPHLLHFTRLAWTTQDRSTSRKATPGNRSSSRPTRACSYVSPLELYTWNYAQNSPPSSLWQLSGDSLPGEECQQTYTPTMAPTSKVPTEKYASFNSFNTLNRRDPPYLTSALKPMSNGITSHLELPTLVVYGKQGSRE